MQYTNNCLFLYILSIRSAENPYTNLAACQSNFTVRSSIPSLPNPPFPESSKQLTHDSSTTASLLFVGNYLWHSVTLRGIVTNVPRQSTTNKQLSNTLRIQLIQCYGLAVQRAQWIGVLLKRRCTRDGSLGHGRVYRMAAALPIVYCLGMKKWGRLRRVRSRLRSMGD